MKGSGAASASGRAQEHTALRAPAPEHCAQARKALRYWTRRYEYWREKMGARALLDVARPATACPHYLVKVRRAKARAARAAYERWHHYHYAWEKWLPDKWQRIGACETGFGKRPGNWRHANSRYGGAFGFALGSWTAFVPRADQKAGPYPPRPWQATPRQQYEVALAIWRMYGFSGWGCRGA